MKTVTALLIAIAMTCAVAAQADGATREETALALQPSTTQVHGSIVVYSQLGEVDQPTLARWRVTWDVVKRWFGFTDPNVPPPAPIYLLTVDNFRMLTGRLRACGEVRCAVTTAGGTRIDISGPPNLFLEMGFRGVSPSANHELIHMGVEWLLKQDERYYPNDFAHRSPGLASVIQWAMRVFYDRVSQDPTPGTFDRERYQQMVALARELLGEETWDELYMSSHLVSYEEMSEWYRGYEGVWPGSGEEGVATTLISRMIGRVSMHYNNTPGYNTYRRIESWIWHEVNRECRVRGVICSE